MKINIQPIEKSVAHGTGDILSVHSIFHTIQGEGPLTGHPAIFIRLAGCNLQCPGCDTDYTSPEQLGGPHGVRPMVVGEILNRVRAMHVGPRLVVITGGEPFRQNITPLCVALLDEDYEVQIETNGTLPPPEFFPAGDYMNPGAWIVVSPKAGKVHPAIAELAVAWKYVLAHDSVDPEDGLPVLALNHSARPRVARYPDDFALGAVYVQPMDAQDEAINALNLQAVVKTCMRYGYTLQLQTHKILNME